MSDIRNAIGLLVGLLIVFLMFGIDEITFILLANILTSVISLGILFVVVKIISFHIKGKA